MVEYVNPRSQNAGYFQETVWRLFLSPRVVVIVAHGEEGTLSMWASLLKAHNLKKLPAAGLHMLWELTLLPPSKPPPKTIRVWHPNEL